MTTATLRPRLPTILLRLAATLLLHVLPGCAAAQDVPDAPPTAATRALEADVLAEINFARTRPASFAQLLESRRLHYEGTLLRLPGQTTLRTQEGRPALEEAIAFLRSTHPQAAMQASAGLAQAALDHVRDVGPRGRISHDGSDGSSPFERMSRYGRWLGKAGENISFGPDTAREIVLQLIVDDGVPGRGHRHNLFDADFAKVGVAFGVHATYRKVCVMDFANGYEEGSAQGRGHRPVGQRSYSRTSTK